MTQPDRARPPRRSHAEYRWTKPKVLAFLHALARTGSVAAAARAVGMGRQSAYKLRARLGPSFAEVWAEGRSLAADLRASQGDTGSASQGDTFAAQGNTSRVQGDRFTAQGDILAPQGDR
ncbi:hypothetical protein [Novosphingobium sp. AP12]|uniref:hypothetical protein n=1 Tax=Novosphingobium sp. AP12 TaxID=1144305 RepID=UPI000271ED03|nr:hypothetical protein [Novosphingobium sp. AP12]EJL21708.1 hypothetical protein PMI02_04992 [Novosphingobium sp. AP12]